MCFVPESAGRRAKYTDFEREPYQVRKAEVDLHRELLDVLPDGRHVLDLDRADEQRVEGCHVSMLQEGAEHAQHLPRAHLLAVHQAALLVQVLGHVRILHLYECWVVDSKAYCAVFGRSRAIDLTSISSIVSTSPAAFQTYRSTSSV